MKIHGIDHFNIRTGNLNRLIDFYTGVLGFEIGERPPFDSPGAWLYNAGHPLLHVSVGDSVVESSTLPFDHLAFEVSGLSDTLRRLDEGDIDYKLYDVPGRAMKQIFITDPDGISLELNFSEPQDTGG